MKEVIEQAINNAKFESKRFVNPEEGLRYYDTVLQLTKSIENLTDFDEAVHMVYTKGRELEVLFQDPFLLGPRLGFATRKGIEDVVDVIQSVNKKAGFDPEKE